MVYSTETRKLKKDYHIFFDKSMTDEFERLIVEINETGDFPNPTTKSELLRIFIHDFIEDIHAEYPKSLENAQSRIIEYRNRRNK